MAQDLGLHEKLPDYVSDIVCSITAVLGGELSKVSRSSPTIIFHLRPFRRHLFASSGIFRVFFFFSNEQASQEKVKLDDMVSHRSLFSIESTTDVESVAVDAIVDPVSPKAEFIGAMLQSMTHFFGGELSLRIVMNPSRDLNDVPLKSFFR